MLVEASTTNLMNFLERRTHFSKLKIIAEWQIGTPLITRYPK